jgi:3-oxoadipate CoA-transferase, alpha subunit
VTDVLITGGDAGYLPAERLAQYALPMLEDPELRHIAPSASAAARSATARSVILEPDFEPMLDLFRRIVDERRAGRLDVALLDAARGAQPGHHRGDPPPAGARRRGAQPEPDHEAHQPLRGRRGPVDVERSAQNWIDLANLLGSLRCGFHSMYCARPTGEHHYFTAPLADIERIASQDPPLAGLDLPPEPLRLDDLVGGQDLDAGHGGGGRAKAFALKFTQGRNMEWMDRVFLAQYDEEQNTIDKLEPFEGEEFFYREDQRQIEQGLMEAIDKRMRSDGATRRPARYRQRGERGDMIDKRCASAAAAVADIPDGATVMIGGFGEAGSPIELIHALIDRGARDLTVVNNNTGSGEVGLAALIKNGQVRKMICSYPRTANSTVFPSCTGPARSSSNWCRRARWPSGSAPAARASPPSSRPPAWARCSRRARRTRVFDGREYVLEHGAARRLRARQGEALADRYGNLVYNKTARNFGPVMCTAARTTIVQVSEIVRPAASTPSAWSRRASSSIAWSRVPEPLLESRLVKEGVCYP